MEKTIKIRSLLIGLFFTIFIVGIVCRLYWVQIAQASMLLNKAEKVWQDNEVLRAKRGSILDRNGRPLAEDAAAYTVALQPQLIAKYHLENEIAHGLAPLLADSEDPGVIAQLEQKIVGLATKKRPDSDELMAEVEIRNEGWKIDGDKKEKVQAFLDGLKAENKNRSIGVLLKETQKRYYPYSRLASQVLGYMDKEGKPNGGIEAQLNDDLAGKSGSLERQRDRMGIEIPDSKVTLIPPVDGKNIKLTIDQNIQYYVENALKDAQEKWHPKYMTAIVADPKTMEILAMANTPDYDPNRYWQVDSMKNYLNRSVATNYEPGSTFKLVTLAGAIEQGIFHPNDLYQSGSVRVPGATLHDWEQSGWGKVSYLDGLLRSSNVAFVNLGYFGLGKDKLLDYINKFGFGQKTGIDLPGEVAGSISPKWESEFATATYGQGKVLVTPIQLTAAYGAIANGGKLMWPHVVKEIDDPATGEPVQTFAPKVVRQAVPEDTAKQTVSYLEQVVSNQDIGTGKKAFIDGYRVAGKTGTAQIVPEGGNKYSDDTWLISFVGFAPVENPQLLVTIMMDQPDLQGNFHLGSNAWAPIFRDIMTQSLSYLGIPATESAPQVKVAESEPYAKVPDVRNNDVAAAKTTLSQIGFKAEVIGDGKQAIAQYPEPGTQIPLTQRIYLITQQKADITPPDMTGKSKREALELCGLLGIPCTISGEGYVASQTLSGEGDGKSLALELKPLTDAGASESPEGTEGSPNPGTSKSDSPKQGAASPTPTPKASGDKSKATATPPRSGKNG